jgi:filamentous hemagglutinin family protein
MNALCYKIVFSKRLGTLVAVGEHTVGQGKTASGSGVRSVVNGAISSFIGALSAVFAAVALTFLTASVTASVGFAAGPAVNALPSGASVNSGSVAISSTSSSNAAVMNITQTTDKASVNWQSFNIGSAARVNVQQNSASSVLLNRVVGNDPSQIFGKLSANGQVILINSNGIVFGSGGSVTASAFTASTFGLSEQDFASGKYKYTRSGSTAGVTVENGASVNATAPGGYVALMGASVDNQGHISTQQGAVVLAAGESITLPAGLTNNISVPLSGKVRLELLPSTINAMVANSGTITTEGGQVLMQAAALSDAVASVTHAGVIDTTGSQGGAVSLLADGGIIKVSGAIKANSTDASNKGGDIIIGRDTESGVLAKSTDVSGAKLESQGGFVETSGEYLAATGVSVIAKDWLLDPNDIEISNSPTTGGNLTSAQAANGISQILASDISNALTAGITVTIATSASASGGNGDITVKSAISNTATNNKLILNAGRNIVVNNGITVSNLELNAASGSVSGTGNLTVSGLTKINSATAGKLSGSIAGGAVLKTGAGETFLAGNNTFSGGLTISKGSIVIGNGGVAVANYNKASGTRAITLGDTNTGDSDIGLFLDRGFGPSPIQTGLANTINVTNNGTGIVTLGGVTTSTSGPGWTAFSSQINLNKNINFRDSTGDRTSLDGLITGTGNITLTTGRSTMSSSVQNTWTGDYIVNSGAILQLGSTGVTANKALSAGNNLVVNGELRMYGGVVAINSLTGSGSVTSQGGAAQVSVGNNNGAGTFSGTISGSGANALSLVKNGSGTQILTGTNTYSGTTSVNAGTLQVGNGGAAGTLGSGAVTIAAPANVTAYRSDASVVIANTISGAGALNFLGTGVSGQSAYSLSANNSNFTGKINLTASRLTIGAAAQVGTASINVNSGASVYIAGGSTINNALSLAGNGWAEGAGAVGALRLDSNTTYGGNITLADNARIATYNGQVATISGVIDGTKNIEFSSMGTVSGKILLTGKNTYSGTTTVSGGTLQVGNGGTTGTLGSGAVILVGNANLNFVRSVSTSIDNAISGNGNVTASITGTGSNLTLNNNISLSGASGTQTNNAILSTTGSIIQTAGKNLAAKNLYMAATNGDIGSSVQRINSSVDSLSLNSAGSQYVTVANAVNVASKTTNNGSIDVATANGTMSIGSVNSINGVTANGSGNITLTGNATTGNAISISNVITTSSGVITLDGTSSSGDGILIQAGNSVTSTTGKIAVKGVATGVKGTGLNIGYNASIRTKGDVELTGTTTANNRTAGTFAGLTNAGKVEGKNITLTALASNTTADVLGYYGAGGNLIATNTLTANAESKGAGVGFYMWSGITQSGAGMEITGANKIISSGIGLDNDAKLINTTSSNIVLKGLTNGNISGGVDLLKSTIQNTSNDGGVQIMATKGGIRANFGSTNTNTITNKGTGAVVLSAGPTLATDTGAIDGTNLTIIQSGNGGVQVTTSGTGNVTAPKIYNSGTGDVVVAAGTAIAAGTGAGGQVKTVTGNTITQSSTGKTYIYTGSVASTGSLSNLTSNLTNLNLSSFSSAASDKANTVSRVAYTTNNAAAISDANGGGTAQVFFREAIGLAVDLGASTVNKTYSDVSKTNVDGGNLTADVRSQMKANNTITETISNTVTGAATSVKIKTVDLIDALDIAPTTAFSANNYSTSNNLKVNTTGYGYSVTSGNTYNVNLGTTSANVVVEKKAITLTGAVASDKVYDRTDTATLTSAGALTAGAANSTDNKYYTGDTVSATNTGAKFTDGKNVKFDTNGAVTSQGVTIQDLALATGGDNGNYTVTDASSATAKITPKAVTATGITASDKVYNQSDVAALTLSGAVLASGAATANDNKVYTGDTVNLSTTAATGKFSSANVARDGSGVVTTQAVTVTGLSVDNGNYTVTDASSATAKIIPKAITLTGAAASAKVYDRSDAATLTSAGALTAGAANSTDKKYYTGDTVIATNTGAKFTDGKNVKFDSNGNVIAQGVTIQGLTLSTGGDNGNYTVTDASNVTAKITPKPISALYTANDKVFDGNTKATVTGTLKDIVTGDAVTATHTSATFDTAAAGTNKTVTVAGIKLAGVDASNYKIDPVANPVNTATARASITAAASIPPAPVVPTSASNGGRVKIPTPAANPFQLASAEELGEEEFCSDGSSGNSNSSCTCEDSKVAQDAQICFEKNTQKISVQ